MDWFSVNKTFFTMWDYQMSYIEFFGTLFNLACVWLVAKKKISNWAVGIVGSILFLSLFYQLRLYADVFEQVYFIITGFWGWWMWDRSPKHVLTPAQGQPGPEMDRFEQNYALTEARIVQSSTQYLFWTVIIIGVGTCVGCYIIGHLNDWLPNQFPDEASFLVLDVMTTVWSFVATVMMMQRRLECWILWIMVDIIGIGLYFRKDVPFIAALYVVFLFIAVNGAMDWSRTFDRQRNERLRHVGA